jgi:hypothetical protein
MSQSPSQPPDDPFDGLLLPMCAWKALEDAHITNLQQLQTMASVIDQIPDIWPETAQVIRDRLGQLPTKKAVRVRLVFPKHFKRKAAAAALST